MAKARSADRRPYLVAIPSSEQVEERLRAVATEAKQLRILLRTARAIERAEAADSRKSRETRCE